MKSVISNDQLTNYLGSLAHFSEAEKQLILRKAKNLNLRKLDYFLKEGEMCNRVGFILEGITRCVATDSDGEEITVHFHSVNEFIADSTSFFKGVPSRTSFQAESNCTLLYFDKEDHEELVSKVPNWHRAICEFTQNFLLDRIITQRRIINGRAQESYESLIEKYPDVAYKVPLGHIASYLGITQSTLSRIRKKMMK